MTPGPCFFPKDFRAASQVHCEHSGGKSEQDAPSTPASAPVGKHEYASCGYQKNSTEKEPARDHNAIGIARVNLILVDRQKPKQGR
jgi:hypothetical protein